MRRSAIGKRFLHCDFIAMIKLGAGHADTKHFLREAFHCDNLIAQFAKKARYVSQRDHPGQSEFPGHLLDAIHHLLAKTLSVMTGMDREAAHFPQFPSKYFKGSTTADLSIGFSDQESPETFIDLVRRAFELSPILGVILEQRVDGRDV